MKLKNILSVIAMTMSLSVVAQTAPFFDSGAPERLMTFGARLGVNTSNRSVDGDFYNFRSHTSWGVGGEIGAVVNLNIRNFISIQPGLFFQLRNTGHTFVNLDYQQPEGDYPSIYVNTGHNRAVDLTIPILARGHFNLSDNLRWDVDFGPYVSVHLGGTSSSIKIGNEPNGLGDMKEQAAEFGLKMGSGLTLNERYSFAIHYMAGCTSAWKSPYPGHSKLWSFTVGYDF